MTQEKSKISIRLQIFLALIIIVVIMSVIFSPYGFYTNVHSIRKYIDERLYVAANGVDEIIKGDFIENAFKGDISPEKYAQYKASLLDFKKKTDITYLYALKQDEEGKVYFLISADADFLELYKDPPPDTLEAFETKSPVYFQGRDEDYNMDSRRVMLPFYTTDNQLYIVGADLNVDDLSPLILQSIKNFLLLLSIGFALVFLVTLLLSKKLALPMRKLSAFIEKLINSNFSQALRLDVTKKDFNTKESYALAQSINRMQDKLQEYIQNLELEINAKNKAESELKVAGGIQESFLPPSSFENENLSCFASMKPAKQAGGDLYEFFELPDGRMLFAIGDVSGKGMPAALFMARAMTLIKSATKFSNNLSEMVPFINDALSENNEACTFITFFILIYDKTKAEVEYVNCGHNPPYILRKDGNLEMLESKPNSVLGVFEGLKFNVETMQLHSQDTFISYTDGVTEAMNIKEELYSEERLEKLINSLEGELNPKILNDAIKKSVGEFSTGAEQSDDITLLILKLK